MFSFEENKFLNAIGFVIYNFIQKKTKANNLHKNSF